MKIRKITECTRVPVYTCRCSKKLNGTGDADFEFESCSKLKSNKGTTRVAEFMNLLTSIYVLLEQNVERNSTDLKTIYHIKIQKF